MGSSVAYMTCVLGRGQVAIVIHVLEQFMITRADICTSGVADKEKWREGGRGDRERERG